MSDACSIQSNDRIKKSGKKQADMTAVLIVCEKSFSPMTCREVHHLINDVGGYRISLNSVRSRMTEATTAGRLKKEGRRIGGELDKFGNVNTWSWAGRSSSLPMEECFDTCDKCHGRGKVRRMRPVDLRQGDFIL